MLHLERENDSLTKRNRELEGNVCESWRLPPDPATILDLEAAVRDHAEAERQAHVMVVAAEVKASLWERRVARVEREAAHLRRYVAKLGAHPITPVVIRVGTWRPPRERGGRRWSVGHPHVPSDPEPKEGRRSMTTTRAIKIRDLAAAYSSLAHSQAASMDHDRVAMSKTMEQLLARIEYLTRPPSEIDIDADLGGRLWHRPS